MDQERAHLLSSALGVAVPMRMDELAQLDPELREERIRSWAAGAADLVSSEGDQLMFRTKASEQSAGTAKVFNALAAGLAALAYCPGGVTFMGDHWEAMK